MTAKNTFRVGVTFHSFTHEYTSYKWSFEDMMVKASLLGKGVEIVGPSHHRGFPEVTDEFERIFKSSVERNELIPTCYGTYADPFMLPDRNLTPDEIFEYTIPQLEGTAKLGFPIARLQYFTYEIAERLLPYAEKLKVKMGYELHTPLMIESSETQKLLSQVKYLSSEYLGIIPDCGIFGRAITSRNVRQGKAAGVPEEIIEKAKELWKQRIAVEPALEILQEMGADKAAITWAGFVWDTCGYSDPRDMADFKDYLFHIHGKYFSIVDGGEPDLRYEEVVKTLLDVGYTGWMSSEYEGEPTDSFAIVQEHQAMIQRYIQKHLGS
jgi:sugar phosphate isomerase/epimerase